MVRIFFSWQGWVIGVGVQHEKHLIRLLTHHIDKGDIRICLYEVSQGIDIFLVVCKLDVFGVADLIKISPAKGIRDDEKIARPTPISLGDSQNLLASTAPVTAGIAVDGPKTPQIQLGAGTGKSNATNSGSIKIDSKPKQKDLNPDALKPDQPGTVITGALANRKIIRKIIPPFPEWAKRQGVSATVALRFTVMENGVVRENVVVVRTSGSGEWDRLVIEALKQWQFAALENSGIRLDQSGVITFQFVI